MGRIIMIISEFEIKRIEKLVGQYVESRRPAAHMRSQLGIFHLGITGQSVEIC